MEVENLANEENFDELLNDKRHKEILKVLTKNSEEEDFQKLLEDKRHKEMIIILKKILLSLSEKDTIIDFDVSKIIKEISDIKNDLPGSITNLGKLIEHKLDELKTSNKEINYNWEFIVHRDNKGFITKVDANKVIIK